MQALKMRGSEQDVEQIKTNSYFAITQFVLPFSSTLLVLTHKEHDLIQLNQSNFSMVSAKTAFIQHRNTRLLPSHVGFKTRSYDSVAPKK